MLKTFLATLSLLCAFLTFAGVASATSIPVGVCVAGVNADSCYGDHDVCVGISEEIPACVDSPTDVITCGDLCQPPNPTVGVPVCLGYAMCAPCHDGYAWVGVNTDPLHGGHWVCGECESCGNPIY